MPTLNLRTRVSLIVHAKELKRTTNTGRLATKVLTNSEMRVRGEGPLDLSSLLSSEYDSLLFYPSADALELTPSFVAGLSRPVQLIVPDGNWRQASKVHSRHPELRQIPRVKISSPNMARYHLRAESSPEGMATLEAIAFALRVIEGEEIFRALHGVYLAKLERTLQGRGVHVNRAELMASNAERVEPNPRRPEAALEM